MRFKGDKNLGLCMIDNTVFMEKVQDEADKVLPELKK